RGSGATSCARRWERAPWRSRTCVCMIAPHALFVVVRSKVVSLLIQVYLVHTGEVSYSSLLIASMKCVHRNPCSATICFLSVCTSWFIRRGVFRGSLWDQCIRLERLEGAVRLLTG
ncbi:unnamed protein product, partial [Ectocarpus sp. 4 AP-2014]